MSTTTTETPTFTRGQHVRIRPGSGEALTFSGGPCDRVIRPTQRGSVVGMVTSTGDVSVAFGSDRFLVSPQFLEHVPGVEDFEVGDTVRVWTEAPARAYGGRLTGVHLGSTGEVTAVARYDQEVTMSLFTEDGTAGRSVTICAWDLERVGAHLPDDAAGLRALLEAEQTEHQNKMWALMDAAQTTADRNGYGHQVRDFIRNNGLGRPRS